MVTRTCIFVRRKLTYVYNSKYFIGIFFNHGKYKIKDSLMNSSSKKKQQKNVSIKHKQQQRNYSLFIFTTLLLLDIVITPKHGHFRKYFYHPLRQQLQFKKSAVNRSQNNGNISVSYWPPYSFSIVLCGHFPKYLSRAPASNNVNFLVWSWFLISLLSFEDKS